MSANFADDEGRSDWLAESDLPRIARRNGWDEELYQEALDDRRNGDAA